MRSYATYFPLVNRHAHENLLYCTIAGFARAAAGERLFRSNLHGYEIFYVTSGKGEVCVEDECWPFGRGDLILLNLHARHGYIADRLDPYEFFFITFQHHDMASLLGNWLDRRNLLIISAEQAAIEPLFAEILDAVEHQSLCWETRVSALTYLLVMQFYSVVCVQQAQETQQPGWVIHLKQWIEQHLEQEITVRLLAEQVNMSMYHFTREFKRYFSLSPLEYVIQRRVTRARHLLIKSNQSIEQIARSAGFPSHYSLIHNFKRLEGTTPSAFRKTIQSR